jgi:oligopeptide/dipeptide ABC transporter ATP-binding protein
MTGAPLLSVTDLVKHYRIAGRVIRAVDGVSFTIAERSVFGLVGESGCGKSTLGRLLLRLEDPTAGQVSFDGRDDWLRVRGGELRRARKDIQAVFQDPLGALDPRRTATYSIGEALRAHGRDDPGRVRELLAQVGLTGEHGHRRPRQLSGGQRQRVTIARAIAPRPKFIVCDEATSALDVSVQAQIVNLLSDLKDELGVSYLFISHNLATVRRVADQVAVMYLGTLVETGPAHRIFAAPAHPYTQALLAAVPVPDPARRPDPSQPDRAPHLAGEATSATTLPSGCRFRLRCPRAEAVCAESEPQLRPVAGGQQVACHLVSVTPAPGQETPGQETPEQEYARDIR